MNKIVIIVFALALLTACKNYNNIAKRTPVAEVGKVTLYYDELPNLIQHGVNDSDSAALIQNYINKWAKRELMLQKAEENLSPELKIEISEFQLNYADRKWIVKMNYRASLSDSGGLLSKESVSGEAERLKVTGKSDAEKILGELLSDMVNKLNLESLFQQARQ